MLVVSGLLGGALSNWLLPGRTAWAQGEGAAKELRAERFVLVDAAGEERAALRIMEGEPGLALGDEAGQTRMSLAQLLWGLDPSLKLYDAAGEVLWQAP